MRQVISSALLGLAAAVLVVLAPATAHGEELLVFGSDYSVPKIYSKDGQNHGFLVDVLSYIDQKLPGYSIELKLMPWGRAYSSALAAMGGIVGISKTVEREGLFDFSEPIYTDTVVIVVQAGHAFKFETIADLSGKRIGIGRGGTYGEAFEVARKAGLFRIEEDSGPGNRLRKLLAGRMDCALFNAGKEGVMQALKNDGEMYEQRDRFEVLPLPLTSDHNYLAFAKSMQMRPFLDAVNQVVRAGYKSGEIQKIISHGVAP